MVNRVSSSCFIKTRYYYLLESTSSFIVSSTFQGSLMKLFLNKKKECILNIIILPQIQCFLKLLFLLHGILRTVSNRVGNIGPVCFQEFTFLETIFLTFQCLANTWKVSQRKLNSGQRKILTLTWEKCFPLFILGKHFPFSLETNLSRLTTDLFKKFICVAVAVNLLFSYLHLHLQVFIFFNISIFCLFFPVLYLNL